MTAPDPRLNAFRDDLADLRLRGVVDAPRYVSGDAARICVPVADIRRTPSPDSGVETQFLLGEAVTVFDEADGYAWVQSRQDFYVGYVEAAALSEGDGRATHRVAVPRSFIYPQPDLRRPPLAAISMGSSLSIDRFEDHRGTTYAVLPDGSAVIGRHLVPVAETAEDYVAVAETLLRTPYLWGGASAFGIDCSGLVQLAMRMAGRPAPRDSDMQAAGLGVPLDPAAASLRRGDLVFWRGHVAILTDADTIIHANGHTMDVALEPLDAAIARIGYLYGRPTGYRRPGGR